MARIGIKDFDTAGLWVRDLAVTYRNGVTALKSASFAVPKGSIAALVGVNGAGKSTLFKAIMGFLPAAKGEIGILGQGVKASLKQGLVAYVPQAEEVDWSFPVLVEDVVMMGRYRPHGNFMRMAAAGTINEKVAGGARACGHGRSYPQASDRRTVRRPEASASSWRGRWRRRAG